MASIGLAWKLTLMGLLAMGNTMAWRWGGREERQAALLLLGSIMAAMLLTIHQYTETELGVLAADGLLLIGLARLALVSKHFWPMWAVAFQLVGAMVHLASLMVAELDADAYAVGANFWSLSVIMAFSAGLWCEVRPFRHDR